MNKYLEKVVNFVYSKFVVLINFIVKILNNFMVFTSKHINNYIEKITIEVNNPALDFVERFLYNFIILVYWTLLQLNTLLKNILIILIFEYKMKKIQIYELIFGNKKFPLSTPNLYLSVLKNIPENSKILDFGCGSGICYRNKETIKLINKSNLSITGIDIDKFALSRFQKKIENNYLNSKVKLLYGDIFTMELPKFDYFIFSESAPVLPKIFLEKLILHIKNNLLNDDGKIIFINNLVENPQFITKFLKPKLKYFTTIDFGRTLTKDNFEELKNNTNMNVKYEKLESMNITEIANFFNIGFIERIFNKLGFKNYNVEQYKITFQNN